MPDSSMFCAGYMRTGKLVSNKADMTITTCTDFPLTVSVEAPARKQSKLSYYWRVMRWMWTHREEPDNRAKWKRMERELSK